LTGAVELKRDNDEKSASRFINLGIIIENGVYPYTKTKIIKIVPRYIIFNNLKEPIVIK
jgi:hypothetical protein